MLKSTSEASVQANQLIFRLMKVDVARHYNEPDVATTSTDLTFTRTSLTVQRILSYIYNVEDINIGDVANSGTSVDLKIQCFSCKAIDQMLALINGTKFQEVKFELRKYLEIEGGAEKPYEVVASCSSHSLNDTRKKLCKHNSHLFRRQMSLNPKAQLNDSDSNEFNMPVDIIYFSIHAVVANTYTGM